VLAADEEEEDHDGQLNTRIDRKRLRIRELLKRKESEAIMMIEKGGCV
jgi:hypothetical protein